MSAYEQRSPEWFLARAGKFTGSKFVDLMARNKKTGGKLASWDNLIWQVVCERLTGTCKDSIDAASLRWGRECEPYAERQYEILTGNIVVTAPFVVHPKYDFVGASPDGFVGDDGLREMKCPKDTKIHLLRLLNGMEEEHLPQIQGQLWCTDRKYCDFYSYDPRLEDEKQREFLFTVKRDDEYIAMLEKSVLEAEADANELIAKIRKKTA